MKDETKREIQEMMNAIGALCEINGYMRDQLIANGFTRKEAIIIVAQNISDTFHQKPNNNYE